MRVEYEAPIIEKILDAINDAENHGKTIAKIWINQEEYDELLFWFRKQDITNDDVKHNFFASYPMLFRIHGVLVEKEKS